MHFIQHQLRELERSTGQQQWLACRTKIHADMSRASRECTCDHDDFAEIMAFIIENISPKMTFIKDDNTDFQVYTRPHTDDELVFFEASRCHACPNY